MSTVDVPMPALGQSVAEGTVVRWLKQAGEAVAADESLVVIQTDKAEAELPSPVGGTVVELLVSEGETVEVGVVLARLESAAPATARPRPQTVAARPPLTFATAPAGGPGRGERGARFLSPAVRRLAREHGLSREDVLSVAGTGRGGRVTHADLARWIAEGGAVDAPDERVVPLAGLRRLVAMNVSASRREIPEVNTVAEADMGRLARVRAVHGPAFLERHGFKLSWNALLLKASATALAGFPRVNATFDADRGIVEHGRVHLGMAVALDPEGLVVPVLRDADRRSVRDLAVESRRLAERARGGQLTADDMAGGTCTVTNPGVFGTLLGTPVIHRPQAAIIDFGAIQKRVVATEQDAIAIRPMAYVVLAWDHRVMDGATASRFLRRLVDVLQGFPSESID